ncbi:MAG: nucleotidyltransferase [Acetobacteraceae bacterium]|nr:nucleotidyltransferase [Acetobacteraceae bacterium]
MNDLTRIHPAWGSADPFADPLDALLADIAINIQLPPGLHAKAISRNAAVQEYLSRPESPLHGLVVRFYAQGSMAIDATTSTRGTDDEYDIDGVLELDIPADMPPADVLDLLWLALKDYQGMKVIRQSRCVTIQYADGMHIDVTPARRIGLAEMESVIFHAKEGEGRHRHFEVPMNAYAFAAWYRERTPPEERFSKAYNARVFDAAELLAKADPIVHEVPAQTPMPLKSVTTVALQLIKRFRNIWSADRPGRCPPSVMLSCHAGYAAVPGMNLAEMVIRQARWTAKAIDAASSRKERLDVRNPKMRDDRFTDRWPENLEQQDSFAYALHDLANGLSQIRSNGLALEDLQEWLRDLFGPMVVSRSVKALNDRNGRALRDRAHGYTRSGGLYVPTAPAIIGAGMPMSSVVPARAHTNMGERRP